MSNASITPQPPIEDRPPFIRDQRIFHLTAPRESRLDWLKEKMSFLRRRNSDTGELEPLSKTGFENEEYSWEEIEDRTTFLTREDIRHLVCTQNAGMGKTICQDSIRYFRMASDPGHLCLSVEFARLPTYESEYLGKGDDSFLVRLLYNGIRDDNVNRDHLLMLLKRKIATGKITLCVDATDQTNLTGQENVASETISRAESLANFLNLFPKLRCVVTGRPLSIIKLWPYLYSKTDHGEKMSTSNSNATGWEFVQIDEFTTDEAERFLGPERVEKLKGCEAELLSIPRSLESIRSLLPTELDGVRTSSDIYWRCVQKMLEKAQVFQEIKLKSKRLLMLLSLVAFQQIRLQQYAGTTGDSAAYEKLLKSIWKHNGIWLRKEWEYSSKEQLEDDLAKLSGLNVALDPGIFKDPINLADVEIESLEFRNRTLQEFFAALFVTKFRNRSKWLQKHLYLRERYGDFREGNRYDFWKLACDMPNQARDADVYVSSLSALFVKQDDAVSEGHYVRRSTEMMYRTLWQLVEISGRLPDQARNRRVYECEITNAILQLRKEIQTDDFVFTIDNYQERKLPKQSDEAAEQLLKRFLMEHELLTQGRIGTDAEQSLSKEVVRNLGLHPEGVVSGSGNGFVEIPAGRYWFGEEPCKGRIQEEGFLLSRYPVTNEVLRLFDPTHGLEAGRFPAYSDYSESDCCPAIYVDFYTSYCASLWFGSELPDEFQWERACRGNQEREFGELLPATKYYGGNSKSDLDTMGFYAGNSGGISHALGEDDGKESNDFGLKHMHGSVWELTGSYYSNDADQALDLSFRSGVRVARGGSFDFVNVLDDCRSSFRFSRCPSGVSQVNGFRLSRALIS